ncbi:MAG: hypothetical protein L0Y72_26440, partial [Gemmataceae bacterium]|nr:hypothetical protein [Gemmataceae bacterium]
HPARKPDNGDGDATHNETGNGNPKQCGPLLAVRLSFRLAPHSVGKVAMFFKAALGTAKPTAPAALDFHAQLAPARNAMVLFRPWRWWIVFQLEELTLFNRGSLKQLGRAGA